MEVIFFMTIQLVPNSFQIHCSQNVREAAKISGAISFPYLESQLVLKYLKESETDKKILQYFLSERIHIQENGSRGTKAQIPNSLRARAIVLSSDRRGD